MDYKNSAIQQVRHGYHDYLDGVWITANPYPEGSATAKAWQAGWKGAREEETQAPCYPLPTP